MPTEARCQANRGINAVGFRKLTKYCDSFHFSKHFCVHFCWEGTSINYDFSLRRLPVFRYVADLEEYRNDRDLYFSFDEYPYPYAQTNNELESLILNFDNEKYIKNLNTFFEKLGAVIKPDSSDKIAHLIMDFLNSKNKNEFFKKNKDKFIY